MTTDPVMRIHDLEYLRAMLICWKHECVHAHQNNIYCATHAISPCDIATLERVLDADQERVNKK